MALGRGCPPTAYAATPAILVHLSWIVLALVVAYLALRRTRTLRAWGLLAAYLLVGAVLLAGVRGAFGSGIGHEYRYLTDAASVAVLCLALASMPLLGARESSERRNDPLVVQAPRLLIGALLVAVLASGVFSSATYAHIWHTQNASDAYVHRLQAEVKGEGQVDLAETVTPEDVMSQLTAPRNNTRTLSSLLGGRVDHPTISPRLAVVAADGSLRRAMIELGVSSPRGPVPACGWPVRSGGAEIPLQGRAFYWPWWVRIGYLASANDTIEITMGRQRRTAEVTRGANSLYLHVEGSFDSVRLDGVDEGTTLCVDTIEVGEPVPGGPL